MEFTKEKDKQILEIPLQIWIMAIKKNLDDANTSTEVANALYQGLNLVLRKEELEQQIGSQPLTEKLTIKTHQS